MTLLSICTNAANNCGVNTPSSIIGNADPGAVRLLQLARRTGKSLALRANWTNLITEYVFEAEGSSDFTLPADFRSMIDDTLWDRTRFWRMRGAMSPQQWQLYKSSIIGRATIERRWRIRLPSGAVAGAPTVFSIDPPLSTTPGGEQFVFEYVSSHWCQTISTFSLESMTVVAGGTGYALGDTFTINGGTSTIGATGEVTGLASTGTGVVSAQAITPGVYTVIPSSPAATTATIGSGTGLTVATTAATMPGTTQGDWVADTDVAILDENLIELGVIWRLLARLGLAYAEEKDEYEREVDKAVARDGANAILDLAPYDHLTLIGPNNVPETGFGGVTS
jgi:hypothetical protein